MLNVVHLTDVENISGCLGETMKDCGLTTKPLAALRPVGNSWIVNVQDSQSSKGMCSRQGRSAWVCVHFSVLYG